MTVAPREGGQEGVSCASTLAGWKENKESHAYFLWSLAGETMGVEGVERPVQ